MLPWHTRVRYVWQSNQMAHMKWREFKSVDVEWHFNFQPDLSPDDDESCNHFIGKMIFVFATWTRGLFFCMYGNIMPANKKNGKILAKFTKSVFLLLMLLWNTCKLYHAYIRIPCKNTIVTRAVKTFLGVSCILQIYV